MSKAVVPAAWIQRIADQSDETCRWFAMCEQTATDTMPHPILGDVPICARCKAKAESLRDGGRQ